MNELLIKLAIDSTTVWQGLTPTWIMKPLYTAITKDGHLSVLAESFGPILYGLEFLVIAGIIATVLLLCFGYARFHFKRIKANDETKDMNQEEAKNKKELKNCLWGALGLAILFIALPSIIAVISAAIGA